MSKRYVMLYSTLKAVGRVTATLTIGLCLGIILDAMGAPYRGDGLCLVGSGSPLCHQQIIGYINLLVAMGLCGILDAMAVRDEHRD